MKTTSWTSRALIAACALSLVVAACGGSDSGDTTTTTSAGGSGDSSTTTTTTTAGTATTTTSGESTTTTSGETTTTVGALPDFAELVNAATLEELFDALGTTSFKQRFSTTIESDDPEMSGTFEALYEYKDEPRSLRLTYGGESAAVGEQTFQVISIEDQTWIFDGGTWEEVPSEFAGFLLQSAVIPLSGAFLDNIDSYGPGAQFEGNETVNGRATLHYSFDSALIPDVVESGVTIDDFAGDAWVDEETGVLIKVEYSAAGTDPAAGGSFTVMTLLEVFDIGADFAIDPPS